MAPGVARGSRHPGVPGSAFSRRIGFEPAGAEAEAGRSVARPSPRPETKRRPAPGLLRASGLRRRSSQDRDDAPARPPRRTPAARRAAGRVEPLPDLSGAIRRAGARADRGRGAALVDPAPDHALGHPALLGGG